jgi:hypothetical protein
MSGVKMMKRTRGIEEFEFLGISEALEIIKQNKQARQDSRDIKAKKDRKDNGEESDKQSVTSDSNAIYIHPADKLERKAKRVPKKVPPASTLLWEACGDESSNNDTESNFADSPTMLSPSPIKSPDEVEEPTIIKQTHVLITVTGFVTHDRDDHTYPFSTLENDANGDQYTLIWETQVLKELGKTMVILLTEFTTFIFQAGLQATLLPGLMAALTLPMWTIKLTYLVDNPWGNAQTKAEKTGRVLADTLMSQVQNNRPVTLVGFSLGARVIFYCLLELAENKAFGIIEEVYLAGAPVLASQSDWNKVLSVVSGRFVNGYFPKDSLLSILYRANAAVMWKEVAGLNEVKNAFVENINLEGTIEGHLDYYSKMPLILKLFKFKTIADEFYDQVHFLSNY